MSRSKIILGLIICLALLVRIISLGSIPAGFSPDEASQAYSAYSLLKTGKDEWGIPWPVSSFKSFLDYKAPLQTYLMIPSIAIFGLNEFSARLPSAIFGVLAVLAVYLLTSKLFGLKKYKIGRLEFNLGHLAALFLAISPWHLQFSRTALEVNLASFLFPIGLYFFLEGLEKPKKLIYSAIFWGFCLYTYHAAKVFLPAYVLVLAYEYRKILFANLRTLVLPVLVGIIISSPLIFGTFYGQAGKRGGDLLITSLSDEQISAINNETFYSKLAKVSPKLPRIFHNTFVFSLSKFTENYLSYYTPSFWFTEGGREITYSVIPGRGLLYFWMLPLVAWALFDLVKNKKNIPYLKIIIPWLLLAALPAALTKEGYRPNRAGSFAVLWEMVAAYGVFSFLSFDFKYKKLITSVFVGVSLVITIFYFEDYVFGSAVNYPTAISYGWRDAMNYVKSVEGNYSSILIQQGSQPQSFVAFYLKYDPGQFQNASQEWNRQVLSKKDVNYLDQLGKYQLGKFSFEALNWPEDINKNTLYISKPSALLPAQRRILHKVEVPDGVVFEIFDFNK